MLVKNKNIVMRTVHGSLFLIDISDNYADDKCALYEINEVGKFIWECLDSNTTIEMLVKTLKSAIVDDVPYEVLYDDIKEYINDLSGKGFVLEEESNG